MLTARRLWSIGLIVGLSALALIGAGEAAQFNWQQFKGTQLRVMLNKHPWQIAIEPHLKEFEALTGMKLVVEVYPEDQFRAKTSVELHQPAKMKGNIETPSLMIEKGVTFEGQCKMDGVERGSSSTKPVSAPAPVTAIKP